MKQIMRILQLLLFCIILPLASQGQEAIPATGGKATGTGGSATYTVGQLVYNQFTGTGGFIIQGVQQPYEISIVTAIENTEDITLECMVYPNPTEGSIKLAIGSFEDDNMRFRLHNMNGFLLQEFKIEDKETTISMDNLSSGIYFLKVIKDKLEVKIFKIIKK
jgi:hypothetical protein